MVLHSQCCGPIRSISRACPSFQTEALYTHSLSLSAPGSCHSAFCKNLSILGISCKRNSTKFVLLRVPKFISCNAAALVRTCCGTYGSHAPFYGRIVFHRTGRHTAFCLYSHLLRGTWPSPPLAIVKNAARTSVSSSLQLQPSG